MKENNNYRYLKGSRRRGFFGGYTSLWLADDHLLLLKSSGWADRWRESYRRFYFQDIQALLLSEDSSRRNWAIGLLIPALFFLTMAALFRDSGILFHLPAALIFLIILAFHWFKGPTCITQIQTAVQTIQLPYVRLRAARKLNKVLIPLIEKQQGQFGTEHSNALREQVKLAAMDRVTPTAPFRTTETAPPFNNLAHLLVFILFLTQAGTSILTLKGLAHGLFSLDALLLVAGIVLITMALYRQSKSRLQGTLVWITWIALACMVAFLILNFGLIFEVMESAEDIEQLVSNEYVLWRMVAQVDPENSYYLRLLLTAKAICYGLLGTVGIVLSFRAKGENTDA